MLNQKIKFSIKKIFLYKFFRKFYKKINPNFYKEILEKKLNFLFVKKFVQNFLKKRIKKKTKNFYKNNFQ